jgi:hypothetical protein
MLQRCFAVVFALLVCAPAWAGITTRSVASGLTPQEVANLLTGTGAAISNVRITGSEEAIGSFAGGDPLGISTGVVLSSGRIGDIVGPNSAPDAGADLGTAGHPALDQIVSPFQTFDAMTLEFDVVTVSPTFSIRFVFASEEYREFVGSEFNDVFGFFVNGSNIALAPGTSDPITVNTVNHVLNAGAYRDNVEAGSDTQFDGFTTVLTAVAIVEPNVSQHIRISIADTSDHIYDSAVLVAQGGISGVALAPLIVPDERIIVTKNLATTTVPLSVYYATLSTRADLSASGLPSDSTVTFSPFFIGSDGQLRTNMTVNIGPSTEAGTYLLTIRSALGEAVSFSNVTVVIDCQPPAILGINQPQAQSVSNGSRATLKVTPSGSAPFTYQWYSGFTGMTGSPVQGGTTAEVQTPPITAPTPFWVRVTNPCGSTSSNTAFVSPR